MYRYTFRKLLTTIFIKIQTCFTFERSAKKYFDVDRRFFLLTENFNLRFLKKKTKKNLTSITRFILSLIENVLWFLMFKMFLNFIPNIIRILFAK